MDKLDMKSVNSVNENIEKIGQLFPNVIVESEKGKSIDFDLLKQELSKEIVEGNKEKYQLTWPGKKEAIVTANTPTTKTLRPVREKSVDFDNTQNIYIEGDNLEALKILQESYLNKIKCIYIDPPYNTGKDFIYKDKFSKFSEDELLESGQLDEEGNRLVANNESNGRFHSDWLSMMYPRLKLARNLLKDEGVIFISIDDNEVNNLKKICDEIFGESNFICNFIRKNKAGSGHDSNKIAVEFDYILCYAKKYEQDNIKQKNVDVENDSKYKYEDEYVNCRGKYYLRDLDYKGSYSEKMDYPIITPSGEEIYSGGQWGKPNTWRWSKEKFEWGKNNDYIVFKKQDSKWKVYIKQYQFVDNNGETYNRKIPYRALIDFSNGQGSIDFNDIMETNAFSYPKSVLLLKHLLNIACNKDEIILDFFSGSATTAHAVMQLNSEDSGNRKYIMVQLPEKCNKDSEAYKAGYDSICEIGEERIRRAGKKIKEETGVDINYGFRVYKIDSTNMKDIYYKPNELKQEQLDMFESNIKEDRTAEDLLTQVILDLGLTLDLKIEQRDILDNKIYFVDENSLVACFDNKININILDEICRIKPLKIVFRESSLSTDSDKINTYERIKKLSPETEINII